MTVTDTLARYVASITWDRIPAEVRRRASLLLADTVGSIAAGQRLDSTEAIARGLLATDGLDGGWTIPGATRHLSANAAAVLAGAAAHGFDFDDTHAQAMIHPGAPVIAAVLVAAQAPRHDGSSPTARDIVTGIVAGYEAMARVSYGLNPELHARKGFHLTATTGVFGASAAVNTVLGGTSSTLVDAWGTALSMTAGSTQFIANGAWTKRLHVGLAAWNGYLAAQLGLAGVTGAADPLGGDAGFFRLYSPDPTPEAAVRDLASWELMLTGVKPYSCCRANHAAIEAALELLAEHGFTPADVDAVTVGVAERCHQITCEPASAKRSPRNVVDCQFSMHLCIAQALVTGRFGFDDYEASLVDPDVGRLMDLIETRVDAEAEALYPVSFAGRVQIRLRDGRELESWVPVPLGEPSRMPDRTQALGKFLSLNEGLFGAEASTALFDECYDLAGLAEGDAEYRFQPEIREAVRD